MDFRVIIEIERIKIAPGDIVFADQDGVLIIPKSAEREAISQVLEKASKENLVKPAIQQGTSTVEAFEKFGVM